LSGKDQNEPTLRQWIGCLAVAGLFVVALGLAAAVADALLRVE
jgi:hypothetical protein